MERDRFLMAIAVRSTGGSETSGSNHIAYHAMVADFKGTD